MLLNCCLLHKNIVLPRHAVSCVLFSISTSRSIYVIYFSIIILIFIAISHIISLEQTNLFFRRFYVKFNRRVLLSFCLIFFASLRLVLVIKLLHIKKCVIPEKFWYFLNIKYRDCFHCQYTSLIKFLENAPR